MTPLGPRSRTRALRPPNPFLRTPSAATRRWLVLLLLPPMLPLLLLQCPTLFLHRSRGALCPRGQFPVLRYTLAVKFSHEGTKADLKSGRHMRW